MPIPYYSYVSTKSFCDPVKTVFLFAPDDRAKTIEDAQLFAEESGWIEQVENDVDALVVPVAPYGWAAEPADLPMTLYQECRNALISPMPGAIPWRKGAVWTWEVSLELVGYGEGAVFAGNFQIAHPGFAAASVLVDGAPTAFEAGDAPSEHWLVGNPVDYDLKNRDVPIAMWLMGNADAAETLAYLREVDALGDAEACEIDGVATTIWRNPANAAQQLRVSPDLTGADPRIAQLGMLDFFEEVIRWKNGPDGTLMPHLSKRAFFEGGAYLHHSVHVGGNDYHYAVYLPEGMSKDDVRGLPLVYSIHGRGEPSWIFAQKNGWEDLADETRAFVVVLPDSPHNCWVIDQDRDALPAITEAVVAEYGLDAERVYLSGFSNGALYTAQQATLFPQLYAAASPWNGPGLEACAKMGIDSFVYSDGFAEKGYEIPFWICVGDSDAKAAADREDELDIVLPANGCDRTAEGAWDAGNRYTADKGYTQGERLSTRVFCNAAGSVRVGLTTVKNMTHGAIPDESRAAWEFMKRFRRVNGSTTVEEI